MACCLITSSIRLCASTSNGSALSASIARCRSSSATPNRSCICLRSSANRAGEDTAACANSGWVCRTTSQREVGKGKKIGIDGLPGPGATNLGCPISVTASSLHPVMFLYKMSDIESTTKDTRCGGTGGVVSHCHMRELGIETHLPPDTALRLSSSIASSDTPRALIVADGWLSSRPCSEMVCSGTGTPDYMDPELRIGLG